MTLYKALNLKRNTILAYFETPLAINQTVHVECLKHVYMYNKA